MDALDRHAAALRVAFPDLRVEATAPPLSRGEHVCVPWRATGTHRGDFGVILPASDRFVSLHGLHYLELSDGQVRRARGFFDLYDAATQLGLLPARGGMGETVLLMLRGFGLRRGTCPRLSLRDLDGALPCPGGRCTRTCRCRPSRTCA